MLQFKDLDSQDIDTAIELVCIGMHFDWCVKNRLLQYLYGEFPLYEEMHKASQVIVLYAFDWLSGLLLADMQGERRLVARGPAVSMWCLPG